MAVAVADIERGTRRDPDFDRLERMIYEGLRRHKERTGEDLTTRQLGPRVGFSTALIYGILRYRKRPEREGLIALADFFDDSREEWQEAGGFDVERLPHDRGWTTAERTLARWIGTLSPEDRQALEDRALRELAQDDEGDSEG